MIGQIQHIVTCLHVLEIHNVIIIDKLSQQPHPQHSIRTQFSVRQCLECAQCLWPITQECVNWRRCNYVLVNIDSESLSHIVMWDKVAESYLSFFQG